MKMSSALERRLGIIAYFLLISLIIWQSFYIEDVENLMEIQGYPSFISIFTFPVFTLLRITIILGVIPIVITGPLIGIYLGGLCLAGVTLLDAFRKKWWHGALLFLPLLLAIAVRQGMGMYHEDYKNRFQSVKTLQDCDSKNLDIFSYFICTKVVRSHTYEEANPFVSCEKSTYYGLCIARIAARQKDILPCNDLAGWNRDDCVHWVAILLRDPKFCDSLKTDRNKCINTVSEEIQNLAACENIQDEQRRAKCRNNIY